MDRKLRVCLEVKMAGETTISVNISVGDLTFLFFTINLAEISGSAVVQQSPSVPT